MISPYPSVDLHTHTTYSDGLDTPWELVAKASELGVWHLAITDHDTVEALPEALQAGDTLGVNVISGIELTVQYEAYDDIHMLAYGFDPTHAALSARLHDLQAYRMQRGLDMLQRINVRLSALGKAPLDRSRVLARAQGALARPHLAQELVEQGHVPTFQDAFRDFLIPCNVPKGALNPQEAFELVAAAGGICSLAHPGTLSTAPDDIEGLLRTLKDMGLVGVEAYHHCHHSDFIHFLCACAQRYDLTVTGGSDYHGRPQGASIGFIAPAFPVPDVVYTNLTTACARGANETA
jgi:predicted metal-dependent phosphoesterase TrpH